MSHRALRGPPLPVMAPLVLLVLNALWGKMVEAAGFPAGGVTVYQEVAFEIEDQLVPKRAHHHVRIEHMISL